MVNFPPFTFCRDREIALPVSGTPPHSLAGQADAQNVPLPVTNDTGVTKHITRLALENDRLEAVVGEYFDDQGDEEHAEHDEDEYWVSVRNREVEKDGETDYVEGPLHDDSALSVNEPYDEVDGTYLDAADNSSDYVDELEEGAADNDSDHDDPDVSSVILHLPFAERYYGVAGHMPEDPDDNDDWSSSDYSSEPDYSDEEDSDSESQDYAKGDAHKKSKKRASLFLQYRRILPPNLFTDSDPPIQFPMEPIYHTPDTFDIPQGIYALVKDIALDSIFCEVVMARSMMMRVNDHGLKKGSLCCMKIYPKRQDSAGRTRKSNNQLKTEIKAYQRLAGAAREDKPGFLFLMQLDASLQDESRYFLVMASTPFSPFCSAY